MLLELNYRLCYLFMILFELLFALFGLILCETFGRRRVKRLGLFGSFDFLLLLQSKILNNPQIDFLLDKLILQRLENNGLLLIWMNILIGFFNLMENILVFAINKFWFFEKIGLRITKLLAFLFLHFLKLISFLIAELL